MNIALSSVVFVRHIKDKEKINIDTAFPALLSFAQLEKKVIKDIKKEKNSPIQDWYIADELASDFSSPPANPFFSETKYENGFSFIGEINRAEVRIARFSDGLPYVASKLCRYLMMDGNARIDVVGVNLHCDFEDIEFSTASLKLFNENHPLLNKQRACPRGAILSLKLEDNTTLNLVVEPNSVGNLSAKANFQIELKNEKEVQLCKTFIDKYASFKDKVAEIVKEGF